MNMLKREYQEAVLAALLRPTDAALAAARATMPAAPAHVQPRVTGQLLHAGYDFDGLRLDLYGVMTDDGDHDVHSVAVAGSKVDIASLVQPSIIFNMSMWLDSVAA